MANIHDFDVIIIGAGPAGIFTALKLLEMSESIHHGGTRPVKIAIFEKGKTISERKCYRSEKGCKNCKTCSIMSGWGGSGAFSDGKLTLSSEIGGWLEEYVGKKHVDQLLDEVAERYIKFGAKKKRMIDLAKNSVEISDFKRKALEKGMFLYPFRILHIGSDGSKTVLKAIYDFLINKGVSIFFKTAVKDFLITDDNKISGIITDKGIEYHSNFVVAATGREGADWLKTKAGNLGLKLISNPV
ncbi:MAG: FAD-dependent oxidoreductase, partial [Candidatus Hodarchaeales archaeon]